MSMLIPNRCLLEVEIPIAFRKGAPSLSANPTDFSKMTMLPPLCEIDGQAPFADVFVSWNDDGLYVGCQVFDKSKPPRCEAERFRNSDGLRLCTDMRDTRAIKRASQYCQAFYALPGGGEKRNTPVAGAHRISRAREDAPVPRDGEIPVASRIHSKGYTLEVHLTRRVLNGFDPSEHRRIGFYYQVEDGELGHQSLTVGDEFYWFVDPSTWATLVLER